MNAILARTVLASILKTADRLGATIPKPLATEHAGLVAAADRLRNLKTGARNDVGAVVAAALEADRDPFTDPAVAAAVIGRAVADSLHGVEQAATERTAQFVEEHAATILASFTKPFSVAADTIADAHRILGDVSLSDARAIAKRGGEAGRAWAEAHAAEKVIAEVGQVWKLLSQVAPHAVPLQPQYRLLTIADVPAADWLEHGLTNVKVSPWDAARNGWPLALATPEQYLERIAAVHAAIAEHRQASADAFTDGWRRQHGAGISA